MMCPEQKSNGTMLCAISTAKRAAMYQRIPRKKFDHYFFQVPDLSYDETEKIIFEYMASDAMGIIPETSIRFLHCYTGGRPKQLFHELLSVPI